MGGAGARAQPGPPQRGGFQTFDVFGSWMSRGTYWVFALFQGRESEEPDPSLCSEPSPCPGAGGGGGKHRISRVPRDGLCGLGSARCREHGAKSANACKKRGTHGSGATGVLRRLPHRCLCPSSAPARGTYSQLPTPSTFPEHPWFTVSGDEMAGFSRQVGAAP